MTEEMKETEQKQEVVLETEEKTAYIDSGVMWETWKKISPRHMFEHTCGLLNHVLNQMAIDYTLEISPVLKEGKTQFVLTRLKLPKILVKKPTNPENIEVKQ